MFDQSYNYTVQFTDGGAVKQAKVAALSYTQAILKAILQLNINRDQILMVC